MESVNHASQNVSTTSMPTNAARYQTCPTNGGGVSSYKKFDLE
jgi:hypothetical protein